jgi:DNA-binding response OmpR family regulator
MKSILYIEDNQDTAEAVKIMLDKVGYEVTTAPNGKQGLKLAADGKYDLILLDIMLPDISGWDLFSRMKNKTGVKFAFLSAIPVSQERMQQLQKDGVSDYITKPFTRTDLIQRVNKMLAENL